MRKQQKTSFHYRATQTTTGCALCFSNEDGARKQQNKPHDAFTAENHEAQSLRFVLFQNESVVLARATGS